ncbi:hypothetical protein C8J56DRAFT_798500 [Mycena floridula]|nr:hypothetical protein C8J56DRAFT_798500 [Mycena floridula]
MFTDSADAWKAGYYQWGLNAGPHQDGWNPYVGLPSHWSHDDACLLEECDPEVQVRTFI